MAPSLVRPIQSTTAVLYPHPRAFVRSFEFPICSSSRTSLRNYHRLTTTVLETQRGAGDIRRSARLLEGSFEANFWSHIVDPLFYDRQPNLTMHRGEAVVKSVELLGEQIVYVPLRLSCVRLFIAPLILLCHV